MEMPKPCIIDIDITNVDVNDTRHGHFHENLAIECQINIPCILNVALPQMPK